MFDKQKAKDAAAHALRDAEMKRRRKEQEEADKERQQGIMREIAQIRQQAEARKRRGR